VTPGVLVASAQDDAAAVDEDAAEAPATPVTKPGVSVDEQLTKALDLLKNKAA
jgi:carboxyl-terminal processing protease